MSSNPAKNNGDDPGSAQNTGQKTLQVWSEPLKPADEERLQNTNGAAGSSLKISDAVATIKKEDFLNVAQMPCARGGLLTGIASGTVAGGLRFVARGNAGKAANWAVGFFLLGSTASYEYCQYRRRAERAQMQRTIELVSAKKKEQAEKIQAAKEAKEKMEEDRRKAAGRWYKFW